MLFDSGIRQGSDVIKAIAMGAQAVLGKHMFFPLMGQRPPPLMNDCSWTAIHVRACYRWGGGR